MSHKTDTPRWTVTQFNSALLEHDGETCNEIFCISRDEAECLVDLLNEWTERAEKAEAEVERLDKERRELSRELHMWEMGVYYKPKMQAKIDELKAEIERLRKIIESL